MSKAIYKTSSGMRGQLPTMLQKNYQKRDLRDFPDDVRSAEPKSNGQPIYICRHDQCKVEDQQSIRLAVTTVHTIYKVSYFTVQPNFWIPFRISSDVNGFCAQNLEPPLNMANRKGVYVLLSTTTSFCGKPSAWG